jgi:8-oxo-dGTP pyrophosphatase MutT (NUDIX family)
LSLRPWEVLGSRIVVEDQWIKLRADHCVTQRGAALDPYYVLEYPDWVHVAAFDAQDRLLLVRQYRHGARAFSLELPGGVMDPGESDPLVTSARELREETGYEAERFEHLAALSPNPASNRNTLHIILAENARAAGELKLDASEDIAVEPTPWREAVAMAMAGEMVHSSHVGLLIIALARSGRLNF